MNAPVFDEVGIGEAKQGRLDSDHRYPGDGHCHGVLIRVAEQVGARKKS